MNPSEFEQQLAIRQQPYELLSELNKKNCHLRFTGTFLGETLIWDAELQTLSYYLSTYAPNAFPVRQFIEVGEKGPGGRQILVGLNLPTIDEPTILKTLIMIRQYKRLALGRHEFGEFFYSTK